MTGKVHFDDLTKINVPFGLLDDDTKERLMDWGGELEIFNSGGWNSCNPLWVWSSTYRVKPQPLTKPHVDPDHLADWVKFIARDENWQVWVYEDRPAINLYSWDTTSSGPYSNLSAHKVYPGTCDWKDSLVSVEELRAIKRERTND